MEGLTANGRAYHSIEGDFDHLLWGVPTSYNYRCRASH